MDFTFSISFSTTPAAGPVQCAAPRCLRRRGSSRRAAGLKRTATSWRKVGLAKGTYLEFMFDIWRDAKDSTSPNRASGSVWPKGRQRIGQRRRGCRRRGSQSSRKRSKRSKERNFHDRGDAGSKRNGLCFSAQFIQERPGDVQRFLMLASDTRFIKTSPTKPSPSSPR